MNIDGINSAISTSPYSNRYSGVEKIEDDKKVGIADRLGSDTVDLSDSAKAFLNELLAIRKGDAIVPDYADPDELYKLEPQGEASATSDDSLTRNKEGLDANGDVSTKTFAQTLEELLALFRPKEGDKVVLPGEDNAGGALSGGGEPTKTRTDGNPLSATNPGV